MRCLEITTIGTIHIALSAENAVASAENALKEKGVDGKTINMTVSPLFPIQDWKGLSWWCRLFLPQLYICAAWGVESYEWKEGDAC